MDKSFDVKLRDGRYFKNITFCSEFTREEDVERILDNVLCDGESIKMGIYHKEDTDGENELAEITSDDIEYICESYKYK